MDTKRTIILLSILAFLASIFLPFQFKEQSDSFNQTINISAALIAAIFSVLTFIVAIILFNKYGIDNALLEKQTEVVFKLLEKINGLTYSIENEKFFFTFNLGSAERKNVEEFYDRKLSFSTDYYNDLEKIFEIANSPFTPKSIIQKMEAIQPPVISFDISDKEKRNYAKVYLFGHKNDKAEFGRLNTTDITLYDFIVSYSEIKDSIVAWIKQNTTINTSDLNI
jgi:hypothetical protein